MIEWIVYHHTQLFTDASGGDVYEHAFVIQYNSYSLLVIRYLKTVNTKQRLQKKYKHIMIH